MYKRYIRKLLIVALTLLTVIICCNCVYAANQPVPVTISGGRGSTTFSITTKSNWKRWGSESITLKQKKVTATYENLFNSKKIKTKKYYPKYKVTVKTGKKSKTYTFSKGKLKIKLGRNKTYKITVSTNAIQDFFGPSAPWGYAFRNETESEWWVDKTNKVSLYAELKIK